MAILLSLSFCISQSESPHRRETQKQHGSEESGLTVLSARRRDTTASPHHWKERRLEDRAVEVGTWGFKAQRRDVRPCRDRTFQVPTPQQKERATLCFLLSPVDNGHRIPPLPGPNNTTTNPNTHTRTHLSDRRVLVHRHGDLARRGVLSKIPRGKVSVVTLVLVLCEGECESLCRREEISLAAGPTISLFPIFIGFPHSRHAYRDPGIFRFECNG